MSDLTFNELGLSAKVLAAVEAAGYTKPTPIQAAAIPHALARRDVLGLAQTGTGKTASFVLPMLSLLESGRARARMPRTLILEPTRELAAQVDESFIRYGANHKLKTVLLIGGVSDKPQMKALDRGVDVVIATPGRMLDMFERGGLMLQQVEIFVVDEADRMLDMGFIPDIERICKLLPPKRQTLFFSATMPKEIVSLVDRFLKDPVRVEVSPPSSAAETVEQRFVRSGEEHSDKRNVLRRLLQDETELTNGIIFVNRKRDIGTLFRSLERYGFSAGALHGDMDQRSRMATLEAFKQNKLTLLVASDVAARGLDIPKVSHIFNYDVPINAEDYIHRIGRTGRAGRSGKSFTIATSDDRKLVAAIEALLKRSVIWADGFADRSIGADEGEGDERRASRRRSRSDDARPRLDDGGSRSSRGGTGPRPPERVAAKPSDELADTSADRSGALRVTRDARIPSGDRLDAEARSFSDAGSRFGDRARPDDRARSDDSPFSETRSRADRTRSGERARSDRPEREFDEPRIAFAETPFVPAFLLRTLPRRVTEAPAAPEPETVE